MDNFDPMTPADETSVETDVVSPQEGDDSVSEVDSQDSTSETPVEVEGVETADEDVVEVADEDVSTETSDSDDEQAPSGEMSA